MALIARLFRDISHLNTHGQTIISKELGEAVTPVLNHNLFIWLNLSEHALQSLLRKSNAERIMAASILPLQGSSPAVDQFSNRQHELRSGCQGSLFYPSGNKSPRYIITTLCVDIASFRD